MATPQEAAAVLPVLGELLRSSDWRERSITRLEAEWIVKLRTAVPDLPIPYALRYTRRYLAGIEAGEPTDRLDRELAAGSWRSLEAAVTAYYGEGDMHASKEVARARGDFIYDHDEALASGRRRTTWETGEVTEEEIE